MNRATIVSTSIGLLGIVLSMAAALSAGLPTAAIALGFGMMAFGTLGALIGAVVSLGRVWHSAG
ncbi:MAG: hypothetical protein ACR2O2_14505 [Ruegeria sp.]